MNLIRKLSSPIPLHYLNYTDYRNSSIFFTFSINPFSQGNTLSSINFHIINDRSIDYIFELTPTKIGIDSQYFTILDNKVNLDPSLFVSSINNQYFQNTNNKAANFNVLPTSSGDLWFIFRYNINSNGKRISKFNENATNIVNIIDDILFEFNQGSNLIKQWEIRNLQLHGISSFENCNKIVTTNLDNIFIINNEVFNVCGYAISNLGTINPINCVEVLKGENYCFNFFPSYDNVKIRGISIDKGPIQLYTLNTYCFENVDRDRIIDVYFEAEASVIRNCQCWDGSIYTLMAGESCNPNHPIKCPVKSVI